jgi:hypothetical protein
MKATPTLTIVPTGTTTTNSATATAAAAATTDATTSGADTYVSTEAEKYAVARLSAALEDAWNAIRANHPEIPHAVVIIGAGTGNGQPAKWGHYDSLRWQRTTTTTTTDDNDNTVAARYSEILVAGEGLTRPTKDVMGTLLHEAAHALADVHNIRETSRQGRWHNKHFAELATTVGLTPFKDNKVGYGTEIPDITVGRYADTIAALADAIAIFRHPEVEKPKKKRDNSNNPIPMECDCPRKIKVAPTVADAGPIICDVCNHAFTADGDIDIDATPDPTGEHHHGMPTFPYGTAPDGLATAAQLAKIGLKSGPAPVAARLTWRHGKRGADLYRIDQATPKRRCTPAQLAVLDRINTNRRAQRFTPTAPAAQAVNNTDGQ